MGKPINKLLVPGIALLRMKIDSKASWVQPGSAGYLGREPCACLLLCKRLSLLVMIAEMLH